MKPPSQPGPASAAPRQVRVELLPLGKTLTLAPGTPLQDVLFDLGAEFPCGGRGRCKGCRIKVLAGSLPVTQDDQRLLNPGEIAQGWRLACRGQVDQDLKLELAQWEEAILADNSTFSFQPQDGLGVAVDLGTTTVVAQLLDLHSGHVLSVRMGLNQQAKHGADIMSRIDFALHNNGQPTLEQLIRNQISQLIGELLAAAQVQGNHLKYVVLVGNSVMHHLFSGLDIEPLAYHPFEPTQPGLQVFSPQTLGWPLAPECSIQFLPCLGGFVGSDILAGILATGLHEKKDLNALIDLGTNGEIVVGDHTRLLCASTAAGPAFEGARISMGMRAAAGAIAEVEIIDSQLHCRVLGHGAPRGICGSGLVDAVAAALDLDLLQASGRFSHGSVLPLAPPVELSQADIRELQLAKGAIAAGLRMLVRTWGAQMSDLTRIYLAGAFGNYINRASARRIGLLPFPSENILPAGNTALLGAKIALFNLANHPGHHPGLVDKVKHLSLREDTQFQEVFVKELGFPDRS